MFFIISKKKKVVWHIFSCCWCCWCCLFFYVINCYTYLLSLSLIYSSSILHHLNLFSISTLIHIHILSADLGVSLTLQDSIFQSIHFLFFCYSLRNFSSTVNCLDLNPFSNPQHLAFSDLSITLFNQPSSSLYYSPSFIKNPSNKWLVSSSPTQPRRPLELRWYPGHLAWLQPLSCKSQSRKKNSGSKPKAYDRIRAWLWSRLCFMPLLV